MRNLFLVAAIVVATNATAQNNNTATNIIEGGRTLVDLVRVFKMPRNNVQAPTTVTVTERKDSCAIKDICDMTIKNTTAKPVTIAVFRRNGNLYETIALTMRIMPKNQESFYEIKSGVYKMRVETEETDGTKKLLKEGEIKLNACENQVKEIKNE